jgi:uncharacterized paraquat-inducible protein A
MKKINSNKYGGTVIGIGLIMAFVIPTIAKIILTIYRKLYLKLILWISFFIGILILFLFSIWLLIEFHQDKYWNHYYLNRKNEKLKLKNSVYECQSCGNRNVKEADKNCSVCGLKFKEKNNSNFMRRS